MIQVRYLIAGDQALTVEFGNEINAEIHNQVRALFQMLKKEPIPGVIECVPTFRSVLIYYDPEVLLYKSLIRKLKRYVGKLNPEPMGKKRIIRIPVCYGKEYGMDMAGVMAHTGLTEEEVIKRHSGKDYLIYMLGFLPGFAYLGGLDESLETPRLADPRTRIPAGSVGIGGKQTGIYPVSSPGGWRLIGKTPLKPYDITRKNPILYEAGDYIRFYSISEKEFLDIEARVNLGTYEYDVTEEVWDNGN